MLSSITNTLSKLVQEHRGEAETDWLIVDRHQMHYMSRGIIEDILLSINEKRQRKQLRTTFGIKNPPHKAKKKLLLLLL